MAWLQGKMSKNHSEFYSSGNSPTCIIFTFNSAIVSVSFPCHVTSLRTLFCYLSPEKHQVPITVRGESRSSRGGEIHAAPVKVKNRKVWFH